MTSFVPCEVMSDACYSYANVQCCYNSIDPYAQCTDAHGRTLTTANWTGYEQTLDSNVNVNETFGKNLQENGMLNYSCN